MSQNELTTDHQGIHSPRLPLTLAAAPGILPDDAMSEAGRKIIFHQFEIMLQHEPGARAENDEAIHDMRVATRRMRSALKVFAPWYKNKILVYARSLKTLADLLGAVRDLDVFRGKVAQYVETLAVEERSGLDHFTTQFRKPAEVARKRLVAHLDSAAFREFVAEFHEFLTTAGAGSTIRNTDPTPRLVRHVAPTLIYQQYMTMRAYEPILSVAALDTLHQLRIEGKRFRYLLEFFSEVLGAESKSVVSAVKALQDHLGELQDARVAADLLQQYLKRADEREDKGPVLRYLANREAEKQRLLEGVNAVWATFTDAEVRRALAVCIAVL